MTVRVSVGVVVVVRVEVLSVPTRRAVGMDLVVAMVMVAVTTMIAPARRLSTVVPPPDHEASAEQYNQEPAKVASIVLIGNLASLAFVPLGLSLALR